MLEHLGCWTHARRYLVAAADALPTAARGKHHVSKQLIYLIGKLYAAESRTEKKLQQRAKVRRRCSAQVLVAIKTLLDKSLNTTTPTGALGTALHYLAGQWLKLTRYIENGACPIDNNACENAIRPFVIGRKAWLFSDTATGAEASANLHSIIETCKADSVDAYSSLIALFKAYPMRRVPLTMSNCCRGALEN